MTRSEPDDRDAGRRGALVRRVPGQERVTRASPRMVMTVLVAIAVFLYLIRSILLPFVISAAIAFVCAPLVDRVAKLTRLPRWMVATLFSCTLLAAVGGLGALAVPPLIVEVKGTVSNLQSIIEQAVGIALGGSHARWLGHETDAAEIAARAVDAIRQALGQTDVVAAIAVGGLSGAFGLLFTVVLLFYLMIGGPTIARSLLWLVPPRQRPLVRAIWTELEPILFRYFAGMAMVVVYAMTAAYIGLAFVLHLHNAAVLAVVTGLLEMVPIVGPAASAVVAGLFAVRGAAGATDIVAYVIYAVLLRLSIDQLVSPLVLGRAGRVHPVVIIFCFLAGGALFNIVGIILAIPVALTIKTVLAVLYEEPLVAPEDEASD